jgi:hypothetical protein
MPRDGGTNDSTSGASGFVAPSGEAHHIGRFVSLNSISSLWTSGSDFREGTLFHARRL